MEIAEDQICTPISSLISMTQLLFRWPHNSASTIAHLVGYHKISPYVLERLTKDKHGTIHSISTKLDINRSNSLSEHEYPKIVFLIDDICDIERDYITIAHIPVPCPQESTITTSSNICNIAANTITLMNIYTREYYANQNKIQCYIEQNEMFFIEGSVFSTKKEEYIDRKNLYPSFTASSDTSMEHKKIDSFCEIENFISSLRSMGQECPYCIAKSIDQHFPHITDTAMGRILSIDENTNRHTLRKRGQTWRKKSK